MTMHFSAYPESELARLLKERARADGHFPRLPKMAGDGLPTCKTISVGSAYIAAIMALMNDEYKSTANIMALTGMKKGTVWRAVTALVFDGSIEELPRAGRRPAMYRIAQ